MRKTLPEKLFKDAIVEAILELRFETDNIGEVIIGRLNDLDHWSEYTTSRFGTADIPDSIREKEHSLRYQPLIQRRSPDGSNMARFGNHVFSFHLYSPYPGWEEFNTKLKTIIIDIFQNIKDIKVTRIGFRYVNFLQASTHHVNNLDDLSFNLKIGNGVFNDNLNLAFQSKPTDSHSVQTRIATPNYVEGPSIPDDIVCAIDVDVFTPDGYVETNVESVIDWVNHAHDFEKQAFFSLFPDTLIEKLTER